MEPRRAGLWRRLIKIKLPQIAGKDDSGIALDRDLGPRPGLAITAGIRQAMLSERRTGLRRPVPGLAGALEKQQVMLV